MNNDVVALAYGNPDIAMAKRLAPGELKIYYSYGKIALEIALGRVVRSEPTGDGVRGVQNSALCYERVMAMREKTNPIVKSCKRS